MATTSYGVNHGMAVKAWARKLFVEALKMTRYDQFKGDTGSASLITRKDELSKGPGDRVSIGLRMQLTGIGVSGDNTLEGNEEALTVYNDQVFIDQLRHAVRNAGKMSQQRVPFEVRDEAKAGLRDWWADRIDASMFNQLAGATLQQTQGNATQGTVIDTRYSGMQAAIAPDATHILITSEGKAIGQGDTTEASLSATTTFALNLADIDRAVARAKTLTPAIRPIKVNGDEKYVLFIHPYSTRLLRTSTGTGQWQDINKSKLQGGKIGDNPIISGLLGEYNNVMLVEDSRVPCVSTAVTASTSYRRNIMCGAQAAAIAFGQDNGDGAMDWTEELFDYGNQLGVEAGLIFGLKKMVFNSLDFGTLVMSGYAPTP